MLIFRHNNLRKIKNMNKEIQELYLTRELKRTREQSSLIKDIIEIMKKVFDKEELKVIKKNI